MVLLGRLFLYEREQEQLTPRSPWNVKGEIQVSLSLPGNGGRQPAPLLKTPKRFHLTGQKRIGPCSSGRATHNKKVVWEVRDSIKSEQVALGVKWSSTWSSNPTHIFGMGHRERERLTPFSHRGGFLKGSEHIDRSIWGVERPNKEEEKII